MVLNISILHVFFLFFFSSRRRHTRCGRDWSSDVCSSDLYNSIMSGTDKILELYPNIDSTRMGLQGQSWGGYQTAQLIRSEEHTSELQSRPHLVCRLLLEKKKKE